MRRLTSSDRNSRTHEDVLQKGMRRMGAERKQKVGSKKGRVVVADDDPLILEQICALLENNFDVVGRAQDGRELLNAVKKSRPSVAVTDVAMPELSGIEVTRIIAAKYPDVRVVVISGYDDAGFVRAVFEAGASGYVWKADAHLELIPAVQHALRGRAYRSKGVLTEEHV